MSFLAKLFLDNTERQILNADILVRQTTDWLGRPDSMPQGGLINVKIASTHETMFWNWMVSPTMMKNGYIRFYKHDGMSKLFDIEFWDCYCVDYYEFFDDSSNEPLELNLTFSPGIVRIKNVVFEKNWKITDITQTAISSYNYLDDLAEREEKENPDIVKMYYTDLDGNDIEELFEEDIILVLKTKNCIGKEIDLNLSNELYDFVYGGRVLENDTLKSYYVSADTEEILLTVKEQD